MHSTPQLTVESKVDGPRLSYGTHQLEITRGSVLENTTLTISCRHCKSYSQYNIEAIYWPGVNMNDIVKNVYVNFCESFFEDCEYQRDLSLASSIMLS